MFPRIEKPSLHLTASGIAVLSQEPVLSPESQTLLEEENNLVPISSGLGYIQIAEGGKSPLSRRKNPSFKMKPMNYSSTSFSPFCEVQVLRSISQWSGSPLTETSIHTAYLDLIKSAKHFIYIENQYFISSMGGGSIKNQVAEALYLRIKQAIVSEQIFRVIIILPTVPTGASWKDSVSIQYVMNWQYLTINRQKSSLLQRLSDEFPKANLTDYISFCSLRNHGYLLTKPVSSVSQTPLSNLNNSILLCSKFMFIANFS